MAAALTRARIARFLSGLSCSVTGLERFQQVRKSTKDYTRGHNKNRCYSIPSNVEASTSRWLYTSSKHRSSAGMLVL